MMRLWHFSRFEIAMKCRCSCYSRLHTQIFSSYTLRKRTWYSYKMAMTVGVEKRNIDCEFPMDCICCMMSICQIRFMGDDHVVWGLAHECVMTYWDQRERVCNLSVLPLLFSMLRMWHETSSLKPVHSLHDIKTVTSELCLLPFLSAHTVASSTIFRGSNMPMCLIADTHSPKAWTTLWTVSIFIASMKECLLGWALMRQALVSVFRELQTKFWCKHGLWCKHGTMPKNSFRCFFASSGISKLGHNFCLAVFLLHAISSNCCVLIWFHLHFSCFDVLSNTCSVAENDVGFYCDVGNWQFQWEYQLQRATQITLDMLSLFLKYIFEIVYCS